MRRVSHSAYAAAHAAVPATAFACVAAELESGPKPLDGTTLCEETLNMLEKLRVVTNVNGMEPRRDMFLVLTVRLEAVYL